MSPTRDIEQAKQQFHWAPVVDVTKCNFSTLEPTIRLAIQNCDFIAIDCELSGLGDRKKLNDPSIEDRFANASIVAKTRSIIALGLSIFKEKDMSLVITCNKSSNTLVMDSLITKQYQVQTYNIIVLCSEDYIVEPGSVNFLVKHGFNFNQQYSEGVPYYRGNDSDVASNEDNRLRNLITEIVRCKKRLVFHNGFIDIVFLYQNLYAQLPQTLPTFLADICEMFPNGIYDTKYIADYVCRETSTFLEFVFKKLRKMNGIRMSKEATNIKIEFPQYPEGCDFVEYVDCNGSENQVVDENKDICQAFANHGNCKNIDCVNSHDVDYILAVQENSKYSKKKKKREKNCDDLVRKNCDDLPQEMEVDVKNTQVHAKKTNASSNTTTGHRAGMDAFMTGYSYAAFMWHKAKVESDAITIQDEMQDKNIVNKMYLVSKDFPLMVTKSNFSNNSVSHFEKYTKIMK